MPDLIFTIKTPAELEGAKRALELIERQIGKAKALRKNRRGLTYERIARRLGVGRNRAWKLCLQAEERIRKKKETKP